MYRLHDILDSYHWLATPTGKTVFLAALTGLALVGALCFLAHFGGELSALEELEP